MDAIEIGTSPAGVEWVLYPGRGETPEEREERARRMTLRLAQLWERYENRVLRVSGLTTAQGELVEEQAWRLEQHGEPASVKRGRTFVEGPRWYLQEIAAGLEVEARSADHEGDIAGHYFRSEPSDGFLRRQAEQRERCYLAAARKVRRIAGEQR